MAEISGAFLPVCRSTCKNLLQCLVYNHTIVALINNALLVTNTDLLNKSYLLYWMVLHVDTKPSKQLESCYSISLYCRLLVVISLSAFLNSCIGFLLDHYSWHKKETCPFKLHFMKRKGRRGNTGFHRIVESRKLEKTLKIIPRKEEGVGERVCLSFWPSLSSTMPESGKWDWRGNIPCVSKE